MTRTFQADERLTTLGSQRVRSLNHLSPRAADAIEGGGLVVLLPGLGLPGYTLPTAAAIAARGVECAVLDIPGFGSSEPRSARPHIDAIGAVATQWILQEAGTRPVVVLGHSTGAQAALTAALGLQTQRRTFAVVMAGPTFRPEHRRVPRLLAATPFAYRNDAPAEIDVMEVLRARFDLLRLAGSGLRDAPESRIAGLVAPVAVTAGEHDSYAPSEWVTLLARSAVQSSRVRTSIVGGSHNNLYTHPAEVADVALLALEDARTWH
jgi:pimeloyl-ACP methyl ester carboxylesterase